MPRNKDTDSDVGYGKPPHHTRFKRGQSGNPKGRPAGRKNLSTVLSDALQQPVPVVENGRRKTITKLEAIVTQLVNRSAAGDPRATQQTLALAREVEPPTDASGADPAAFTEADLQIVKRIQARLRGKKE
ncbi:MAG: DUF5681 domain-containing protein [Stellaceae bacterium]